MGVLANIFKGQPKKNKKSKNYILCSKCGTKLVADSEFCMECGAKVENKISAVPVLKCSGCGADLSENDSFCVECGKSVDLKSKIENVSSGKSMISYKTEKLELPSSKISIPERSRTAETTAIEKNIVTLEKNHLSDERSDSLTRFNTDNSASDNLVINIKSFNNEKSFSEHNSEMKNITSKKAEIKGNFKRSSDFDV